MSSDKIYNNGKTYYSKRVYDSKVRKAERLGIYMKEMRHEINRLNSIIRDYEKCKTYSEIEVLNKKYSKVTKK